MMARWWDAHLNKNVINQILSLSLPAQLFASVLCTAVSGLFPAGCDNFFTFSFVITAAHQWMLTVGGLGRFIQSDNRRGLVAANKEGIISNVGFVALYLFFVQYGRRFLPKK